MIPLKGVRYFKIMQEGAPTKMNLFNSARGTAEERL